MFINFNMLSKKNIPNKIVLSLFRFQNRSFFLTYRRKYQIIIFHVKGRYLSTDSTKLVE